MNYNKISVFLLLCMVLCSCSVRKYLKPEEVLLKSNKIQIEGNKSIENKIQISEQLSTLYKQKPNSNYLIFIPREWLHFKVINRKNKDSWFSKTLAKPAESPSLLDTTLCEATKNNINNYLYNQGYFNTLCRYEIKVKNKYGSVLYVVNPGERYYVNDIQYIAEDKVVEKIVNENIEASFLKPGSPLDNSLFQNEKARISELLFNNGYVEFNPVYIQTLEVDTIHLKANIKLKINNPEGRSSHPQYTVNKIQVNPYFLPGDSLVYEAIEYDSIQFNILPYYKYVKPKVIASKIKFRPGVINNKSLIDETYSQLSRLGIYRFVNIEAKIDSVEKYKINYNIQLNPLKKWVFDFGADFNYTSIKTAGKTLFGISGFANLKNRHLFKGAESFTTKIEVGTELNVFDFSKFNSLSMHYSNELSLASFYDLTGTWGISKFLLKPFANLPDKPDSRTNIRIGADYEKLTELYNYISLNANVEYEWQLSKRKRFSLHTLGFSLYVPQTETKFDSILELNPFLKNSFKGKRLFTSYFLDNITYYYQSKIRNNSQHAFIGNFNISGFEAFAINRLYNSISNSKDTFSLGEFEFSNFIKPEFDYRYYYTFSEKSKLATRVAFGIAIPYGNSTSIPYIKQFYVGGPQSLRAWNIRELGPGSNNLSNTIKDRPAYFASGDIKLEGSVEYRFDIFWRLEGALFLDAGNIWLLPKPSEDNEAGNFDSRFYEDLAIGTGLGIRLDLSYFLFRVDIGFKLRNPYETNGSHWIYNEKNQISVKHLFENSTLHLALDYPF